MEDGGKRVLSKEVVGIAITILIGLVAFIYNYTRNNVERDISQIQSRIEKVEDVNVRQDKDIQDVKSNSLVIGEILKSINEKLDDLKKSLQILQSQQMKIK